VPHVSIRNTGVPSLDPASVPGLRQALQSPTMEVLVAQLESWQQGLPVRRAVIAGAALALVLIAAAGPVAAESPPSILVITVDALRADRLGAYGYRRDTSPAIDRLLGEGARFTRAWTPEPLTAPAMCAMVTGLEPHRHGASRNGLRMQPGLDSLPKILARSGWTTAAAGTASSTPRPPART
jgi:hypothetical protein